MGDRYFTEKRLPFKELEITREEFHHLCHVKRAKEGKKIELIDGKGYLAYCTIKKIKTRSAILSVFKIQKEVKPPYQVTIAQAVTHSNHLKFLLEKGTELNADNFIFFPATFSEKKYIDIKRAQKITIAALKQCQGLFLPQISYFKNLESIPLKHSTYFFGDTRADAPYLLKKFSLDQTDICFFIGPEKGFTKEETTFLKNKIKATGIRLHLNILRAETAAIAFLSIVRQMQIQAP